MIVWSGVNGTIVLQIRENYRLLSGISLRIF